MGLVHQAIRCVVFAIAVVVFASAPARAGTRTIALHPLVVVGGEGTESREYQKLLDHALAKAGVHPAHPEQVDAFLARTPSHTCPDDACLAQLAQAATADAALLVSISPYTPRLLVSVRLVSHDGAEIAAVTGREFIKGGKPLGRVVRDALDETLQGFPFDAAEPAPPAPQVQNPVATDSHPAQGEAAVPQTHAPTDSPSVPPTSGSASHTPAANPVQPSAVAPVEPSAPLTHPTLRTASYLLGGAGAAALIGATTVALLARSDRAELELLLKKDGSRPATPEAQALDQSLASRSRTANLLLVGGGAALAAGVTMFFLSRPTQAPAVSLAVTPQGAFAAVDGRF